jgi:polar amino acid transport system substrate-binding protein
MVTRSAFSERFAFFAGFGLALVAVAPETARADGLETLNPGVLQVAIEPYMPYTALKDGKLVGLDSDILAAVASKLGLKIETSMTDFPGMLAAVQSQRADYHNRGHCLVRRAPEGRLVHRSAVLLAARHGGTRHS